MKTLVSVLVLEVELKLSIRDDTEAQLMICHQNADTTVLTISSALIIFKMADIQKGECLS